MLNKYKWVRMFGENPITGIVMLAALVGSSSALSHVVLQDPPARTPDSGLTQTPCGGKQKGASVAAYAPDSNIEITFELVVQHSQDTSVYISFDDFATRTRLATLATPESDIYKMNVPLPMQPTGRAVLQLNHQDYYSCADITLGEEPEFVLNAGLNDAWYNPVTDGQGFFITVFPDLNAVSLAWFTYDTELPSEDDTANLGDPGHRWLTALGPISGNQVIMEIELTSGGLFDTVTAIDRTNPPGSDGTITLTFSSCNSGTIEYNIPSINKTETVPIQRVANDNVVICEALNSDL